MQIKPANIVLELRMQFNLIKKYCNYKKIVYLQPRKRERSLI